MATLTMTLDDVRDVVVAANTPDTEQTLRLLDAAITEAIQDLLACQVLLLSASRAIATVEKSLSDAMDASDDPMIRSIAPVIDALNSVPPLKMSPFREIYFPGSDADASR